MSDERQLQLSDATIGVITALPKEYAAAKEVMGCHEEVTAPGNGAGRTFALGRIKAKNGAYHIVAVAMLVDMGNNMSAITVTNLLNCCRRVDLVIMCGIAGAIPNPDKTEDHVRLGDIVVADRGGSIQYDLNKEESANNPQIRNPPRPPSPRLLEAVRRLQEKEHRGVRPWEGFISACVKSHPGWKRPGPKCDVLCDVPGAPASHPVDPRRRRGWPRVFYAR